MTSFGAGSVPGQSVPDGLGEGEKASNPAWSLLAIGLFLIGLAPGQAAAQATNNILLIIADDFATDGLRSYNTNQVSFPPMPTVERLAENGVTFRNAYGYPTCSPSRSLILTGRYGFRTGIGYALANPAGPSLRPDEFTLPNALSAAQSNVRHGMVGKWHLSFEAADPNTVGGFSYFSGGILGELLAYNDWPRKVTNGVTLGNALRSYTNYATTDNLKDATNWIGAQGTNTWFLWLAFNACHEPLHLPPTNLHTYRQLSGTSSDIETNSRPYYEAMAQSLDTTVSNLLAFLGPQTNRTTVIFLGDNGTPARNIQAPFTTNQCKGTLYEGGIHVPLVISGAGVIGRQRRSDAVVSLVDLYATILELGGVHLAEVRPTNTVVDSQSLVPILRDPDYTAPERYILAENFSANLPEERAGRAVRNGRYKLILFDSGLQEMYDLHDDPYEHANLLLDRLSPGQQTHYAALLRQMENWQAAAAPTVTDYRVASDRFTVSVSHPAGTRCWLWRSTTIEYPVWAVLTNASNAALSSTSVRLTDTNAPTTRASYRVSLRPVEASTNVVSNWKDWD
jgi:arylsulfatase B